MFWQEAECSQVKKIHIYIYIYILLNAWVTGIAAAALEQFIYGASVLIVYIIFVSHLSMY